MIKGLVAWFRRKREDRAASLMPEGQVAVHLGEQGISATYPDGTKQSIAWSDVVRIAIETNDSGPWGADVWWLVEGTTSRCAYPQGATGDPEALSEYPKRFSGFNHAKVIEAMSCTSNARFVCWERPDAL